MTTPTAPTPPADVDELLAALHTLDTRGTHPALGPDLHHALTVVLTGYRDLVAAHVARGEQLRTRCVDLHHARATRDAGWRTAARHARTLTAVRAVLDGADRYVETVDVERALAGPTA